MKKPERADYYKHTFLPFRYFLLYIHKFHTLKKYASTSLKPPST